MLGANSREGTSRVVPCTKVAGMSCRDQLIPRHNNQPIKKRGISWCSVNSFSLMIIGQFIGWNELVQCQLEIACTTRYVHANLFPQVCARNHLRCSISRVGAQHIHTCEWNPKAPHSSRLALAVRVWNSLNCLGTDQLIFLCFARNVNGQPLAVTFAWDHFVRSVGHCEQLGLNNSDLKWHYYFHISCFDELYQSMLIVLKRKTKAKYLLGLRWSPLA